MCAKKIVFIINHIMAKKNLTFEQQNWLFMHFPEMTNRELAEKLTEMVKADNKKQLARLKPLLEENFSEGARKIISKKIEALEKFSGFSEAFVKRYARELKCPPKSRIHLVSCNQQKARATNIKKWQQKAEKVEHIMDWLRTFDEKDIRFCTIEGDGQLKSYRVSINKFTRYEGYDRGVYLTSEFIPEVSLLRVRATLYRTA